MADGVTPYVDGQVWDAIDANIAVGNKYISLSIDTEGNPGTATSTFLAFTPLIWVTFIGSGDDSRRTTDGGVTWADCAVDNTNMIGPAALCKADATLAIVSDSNTSAISFTTNSGDDWSVSGTPPPSITSTRCLSFPTALVAVLGADVGGASRSIFYSINGGSTWTICVTGPTTDCAAIDMFSATHGLAVDVSNNIWFTVNGGVDWDDSLDNVSLDQNANLIALTATTGISVANNAVAVHTFSTAADGVGRLYIQSLAGGGDSFPSNLVKSTNGNIYFVAYLNGGGTPLSFQMTLYRSTDNGVTWSASVLPGMGPSVDMSIRSRCESMLHEYDTDKLLLIANARSLMKIDVSGDL